MTMSSGSGRLLKWIVLAALAAHFVYKPTFAAKKPTEIKRDVAVVFTTELKSIELSDSVSLPAQILPDIHARVLSETDGVVTKISKELGTPVRSGAQLIVIKRTDPVYQYAPYIVRSPVKGLVSSVAVTIGSQVKPDQLLATVTDPKKITIRSEVPSRDLALINRGDRGMLTLHGKEAEVEIVGVSPFVDPATGTATSRMRIVGKTDIVPSPGQLGRVDFKTNMRPGFVIPDSSVVYKGKDSFVRVVENEKKKAKVKLLPVVLGQSQGAAVEVLEGLKEGLTLVLRTSRFVSDGEEVKVMDDSKKSEKKG